MSCWLKPGQPGACFSLAVCKLLASLLWSRGFRSNMRSDEKSPSEVRRFSDANLDRRSRSAADPSESLSLDLRLIWSLCVSLCCLQAVKTQTAQTKDPTTPLLTSLNWFPAPPSN